MTGPKGSGKDTVASLIKEIDKTKAVETIAFADPIKETVKHIFNLSEDGVYGYDRLKRATLKLVDHEDFWSVDGRRVVREIGMLMREYNQHQFTDYVKNTIKTQPTKIWVVTDLRFDNEYIALKKLGAKIVKIIRPQYQYDGHITERAFDDHLIDKSIMNDGDIGHLRQRTEIVFKHIMEEWNEAYNGA